MMDDQFDKDKSLKDQTGNVKAGLAYRRNTINEHEARGLSQYESSLGFNRKDLEGKVVLDLGSSSTEKLARDIKEAGINAQVISLSPDYKDSSVASQLRFHQHKGERTGVAGIAQAIPLLDNSVDVILSDFAITYAASTTPDQVKLWVKEIARVLRDGGEARMGPRYGGHSAYGKDNEDLIRWSKEAGLDLDLTNREFLLFRKLTPTA